MAGVIPIHENQLIDVLYTLDAARRGILELRYSRGLSQAAISELLGLRQDAVEGLLEEGVEGLVLALNMESIDQGVTLILTLTELPRAAWGDHSEDEIVGQALEVLERRCTEPLAAAVAVGGQRI